MSFIENISAPNNHPGTFRIGIVAGFVLYSLFGILDYYMLPSSYLYAWKIRFFLVGPSLILPLILSYFPRFQKYLGLFTTVVVGVAQLGIFLMIFAAKPYEGAYYDYYLGLILVVLWTAFIFKMKHIALWILVALTWIIYIVYSVNYQELLSFGFQTPQFASFFNNVMFLVSITSLAILGNFLIDQYYSKLEKEKKNLEIALEKAQESENAKSSFLSTMSHEIRTPLNGIIGFSDIMLNEDDYESFGEMAQVINRQGLQLLNIVDSILQYTEIQTIDDLGEKSKISGDELLHLIRREFEYIKSKFNKNELNLIFENSDAIKTKYLLSYLDVFTDVMRVLLENAVKFSDKGDISIIFNILQKSDLVLRIKDEGIGIEEKDANEIFSQFFQVESGHNRKYEGIGMGLTFAKKIVYLLGGNIWHENNDGPGSSFYIHIPNCLKSI